jgi:hypothetical protein
VSKFPTKYTVLGATAYWGAEKGKDGRLIPKERKRKQIQDSPPERKEGDGGGREGAAIWKSPR